LHLRIVTYNIHKCRGLDRRVRPARIVDVLREIDADIIALQEVMSLQGALREKDQARFISEEIQMACGVGGTRIHKGAVYGNVVLSRLPLVATTNYDISVQGREQRGCMRADIRLNGSALLHVFNVHLGTAFMERRHQGRKLVNDAILNNKNLKGMRIMLGDFNEWTRGLTTRLLTAHLTSADIRAHLRHPRTYPGVLPFMHLDHVYFEDSLHLERLVLHRSRASLIASDHLPLVADFQLSAEGLPGV
jgi:endonuclease/exonuclease/phosphatase family metal-dependent hydrolase